METLHQTPIFEELFLVLKEKGSLKRQFTQEEAKDLIPSLLVAVGEWQDLKITPFNVGVEIKEEKLKVEAVMASYYLKHPFWQGQGGRVSALLEFENDKRNENRLKNTKIRLVKSELQVYGIPVSEIFPMAFLRQNFAGTKVNERFTRWIAYEVKKRGENLEVRAGLHLEEDKLVVDLKVKFN